MNNASPKRKELRDPLRNPINKLKYAMEQLNNIKPKAKLNAPISYNQYGHAIKNGKPIKRVPVQGKSDNISKAIAFQRKHPSALGFNAKPPRERGVFLTGVGSESESEREDGRGRGRNVKNNSNLNRNKNTSKTRSNSKSRMPAVGGPKSRNMGGPRQSKSTPGLLQGNKGGKNRNGYGNNNNNNNRIRNVNNNAVNNYVVPPRQQQRRPDYDVDDVPDEYSRQEDYDSRDRQRPRRYQRDDSRENSRNRNYREDSRERDRDKSRDNYNRNYRNSSKERGYNREKFDDEPRERKRYDSRDRPRDDSRERPRDDSRNRKERYRSDSREDRNYRGNSNNRDNSRERYSDAQRDRSSSRDRRNRNDSRDRVDSRDRRDNNDSRDANDSRGRDRILKVVKNADKPPVNKQQEFYEAITAKKKQELLNFLKGSTGGGNPDNPSPATVVGIASKSKAKLEKLPEITKKNVIEIDESLTKNLTKLGGLQSSKSGNDDEALLGQLALHAKRISEKFDKVSQHHSEYTKLKSTNIESMEAPQEISTVVDKPKEGKHHQISDHIELKIWNHPNDPETIQHKLAHDMIVHDIEESFEKIIHPPVDESETVIDTHKASDVPLQLHADVVAKTNLDMTLEEEREAEQYANLINRNLMNSVVKANEVKAEDNPTVVKKTISSTHLEIQKILDDVDLDKEIERLQTIALRKKIEETAKKGKIAEMLLDANLDPKVLALLSNKVKNGGGKTPLQIADDKQNELIKRELLAKQLELEIEKNQAAHSKKYQNYNPIATPQEIHMTPTMFTPDMLDI